MLTQGNEVESKARCADTACTAAAPAPPATAAAPTSMPELLQALQRAIDEEKATGQVAINAVDQTPESAARLSARVQALLSVRPSEAACSHLACGRGR